MTEISPVPDNIKDTQFEGTTCKALSLTFANVTPADLQPFHRIRQEDWVIGKFLSRKKRNNLIFIKKNENKKSQTCEDGVAHLKISFWHLLMNLRNK